jgi:hypothetical protein
MDGSWVACPDQKIADTLVFGEAGVNFPVALQRDPGFGEALGQALNQIDRPMLATGTADGNRDVTTVVARQCIEPTFQKIRNLVLHPFHFRLLLARTPLQANPGR